MMTKKDVCIVIVLYNPREEQIEAFARLSEAAGIVMVDNSEGEHRHHGQSSYIPLHENKGIAYAQNRGIEWAREKGYKYVLFFDQDSKIQESYVEDIYLEYHRIKAEDNNLAFLGPVVIDETNGIEYKSEMNKDKSYSKVSFVISSGSLVALDVFDVIGPLDESLFIDYVDTEICWRASSYGLSTYMTRNVRLYHNVGSKYVKILGIPFSVSAPFRYYYQYRNMLWLSRRKYVPCAWKTKSFLRSILDMLIIPFISNHFAATFGNMIKGYCAGLKAPGNEC